MLASPLLDGSRMCCSVPQVYCNSNFAQDAQVVQASVAGVPTGMLTGQLGTSDVTIQVNSACMHACVRGAGRSMQGCMG